MKMARPSTAGRRWAQRTSETQLAESGVVGAMALHLARLHRGGQGLTLATRLRAVEPGGLEAAGRAVVQLSFVNEVVGTAVGHDSVHRPEW